MLADKGGEAQISTAMHVLAQIIASDVSLLVTFNQAIEGVIKNNQKARQNPKALAQLVRDGESQQDGIAAGDHRRDERGRWDQREYRPRWTYYDDKEPG